MTTPVRAEPTYLLQISDTHVVAADRVVADDPDLFVDDNARLALVVQAVLAESPCPDVILLTGDLAADGGHDEYAALVELLAPLDLPLLALPGNHDTRDGVRAAFPGTAWVDADHASWVHDVGGVRIVGLDTTIPGAPGAMFDPEREAWLDAVLGEPTGGRPTVLAMHHPPLETGIVWMDGAGFVGLDRLAAVVARHDVGRIVCGHLHRPLVGSCGGVTTQVAPTTIQSVDLTLDTPGAVRLVIDPIGYLIHRVAGRDIVTHTRYVGTGEEPFRPYWAGHYESRATEA